MKRTKKTILEFIIKILPYSVKERIKLGLEYKYEKKISALTAKLHYKNEELKRIKTKFNKKYGRVRQELVKLIEYYPNPYWKIKKNSLEAVGAEYMRYVLLTAICNRYWGEEDVPRYKREWYDAYRDSLDDGV